MTREKIAAVLCLALLAACGKPSSPSGAAPAPAPAVRTGLQRMEFNRLAVRLNLPLYWTADTNHDGIADTGEVAALSFYPPFDGDLDKAFQELLAAKSLPALDTSQPEGARRALVRQDLDEGRATLVPVDLTVLSAGERTFLQHMLAAAAKIDQVYALQNGSAALQAQLPADPESRSLFRRNRGPKCVTPATEKNPACSAIPGAPQPVVDVYPAMLAGLSQHDPKFCEVLQKRPDAAALSDPFSVVREMGGKLQAVPYAQAYAEPMTGIAADLETAAGALDAASEQPLIDYLRAAAAAFRSNDWWPADEAWARMNVNNSKWYVRVAPDETYWDPCQLKSGFHLTLARINQGSKEWQAKLVTIQQEMEAGIAALAGAPYRARKVSFVLPDFIDIVINAGDDRSPIGATVGQSLPNFGPVVKASRGRTVAMVNLYTDADSRAAGRSNAESLLDAASIANYSNDPLPQLLTTILHEATHNLGPAGEYSVGGKSVRALLGGPFSQLLEELKAETGALYLIEVLRSKGLIDEALAARTYTAAINWTFSQISQGMYSEPGHQRKTYPQLAAIQLGFLMDAGAVTWNEQAMAANGSDKGAFHIHPDKLVASSNAMMRLVAGTKARGDRHGAEALAAKYVDGDVVPQLLIAERLGRQPRASMVYSLPMP